MTVKIRLSQSLLEYARKDLSRPHSFAYERIGFFFGSTTKANHTLIVTLSKFVPVKETHYLRDEFVGAKINSDAIRFALQQSMDTNEGAFHAHLHGGGGTPWFSNVDLDSLKLLFPSFTSVCPENVHGGLVFNENNAAGLVWIPGNKKPQKPQISFIGFPTKILSIPSGGLYA